MCAYKAYKRLLLLVASSVTISTSFISCSPPDEKLDENTFRINYSSGTLESMDPAFAKALYDMWGAHMVYNTLVETNEQLQLVPSLAKRWEASADGLTYTFYLRNDVFFQDAPEFAGGKGRLLTANDVVYSFDRIIDPEVASPGAWIFNDRVAGEKPFLAINDTIFQVKLNAPFRALPEILSMPYCSIVPHEVVNHWGKDFRAHPCGTGPYRFHYWDEGNVLVLLKNPKYWEQDQNGNRLPYVPAVKITFIDSKATEFFLFLQGKLDFVNGLDGSFKDLVLTKNGTLKPEFAEQINLDKRFYLNTEYIGILTDTTNPVIKDAPTRNVLVRRAINYAIDRKKIVTYFKNGVGIPAHSGFIPSGMPAFDSSGSYGYRYDPNKALELLAQAGYDHGKGLKPVTIISPDNWADVVNYVATQLQDVGIPAKVEIMQPNILKQQMSRSQAQMFRGQWIADYPDAETYLSVFNGRFPAPPNYTRFSNPQFDKWYDESMNAPDSIRWKLYRNMDSLAMSMAPLVPLYYDQMLHFTSKRVTGFTANPMNLIDVKQVRLKAQGQ
ncbi:MAG: ABC transporter substrate-binding protein [Sphingobacteriales bacterium]|nr:MAG: ABC transporter substrate-binding protein [Sphingobacteriales bacterium]